MSAATADLTKFMVLGPGMTDSTLILRKRSLWPVFVMPALVVLLAAGWSAFWFYAASQGVRTG